MRKEKLVQINKIQSYEDIRDCYWISNSDEDIIVNRSTNKRVKGWIDDHGYKRVRFQTINGKMKYCRIHVLKAKAFIFGPYPLGANVVRHLNDVKNDNRLENLTFGTQSDNIQDCMRNGNFSYLDAAKNGKINGKINGAKNGRKRSKPVRCIETGIIYPSCIEAERQTGIHNANISHCCNGKLKRAGGYHWEFVNPIAE